jgi:CBS-domain-containing membrane protein
VRRAARLPHPRLRSLLRGGYAGYVTRGDAGLVLPATASVLLVMKVEDSPLRPPQFVMGAHGSYSAVVGACAPQYVQVPLAPIGSDRVLAGRSTS